MGARTQVSYKTITCSDKASQSKPLGSVVLALYQKAPSSVGIGEGRLRVRTATTLSAGKAGASPLLAGASDCTSAAVVAAGAGRAQVPLLTTSIPTVLELISMWSSVNLLGSTLAVEATSAAVVASANLLTESLATEAAAAVDASARQRLDCAPAGWGCAGATAVDPQ